MQQVIINVSHILTYPVKQQKGYNEVIGIVLEALANSLNGMYANPCIRELSDMLDNANYTTEEEGGEPLDEALAYALFYSLFAFLSQEGLLDSYRIEDIEMDDYENISIHLDDEEPLEYNPRSFGMLNIGNEMSVIAHLI